MPDKMHQFYRKFFSAVILTFSIGLSTVYAQTSLQMKEVLTQFTQYASHVDKDWHVPGMAIAIVQGNNIIYTRGFGERNTHDDSVTGKTIFDIASLTKSFTAVLLAMQIDQGKYRWSTKVITLDPSFKLYSPKATKSFEVRDLIAHDSGLPANALDALGNFGYSIKDTLKALQFVKPVSPFRKTFAYQDIFLEVAKKILEKFSGQRYASMLHTDIFKPLGMQNSYVRTQAILNKIKNKAQPFLYYAGKNYPYAKTSPYLSKQWALAPGVAGGGIQSCADDIAKWLLFNINHGRILHQQLVSRKNMQFIQTIQTPISYSSHGKVVLGYGEGWFINNKEYAPDTLLYHPGGGTGMHAFMAFIPQAKLGIVVLTNQYTNKVPTILYRKFFNVLLNKRHTKDWNAIYLKQRSVTIEQEKKAQLHVSCAQDRKIPLSYYIGSYYNAVYGKLNLEKSNHHLLLSIGPQGVTWVLTPCTINTFKAYWPNPNGMNVPMLAPTQNNVYFRLGKKNKVKLMIIPFLNEDGMGIFRKLTN